MATQFSFNGNIVKIPGVYSNIKSGLVNPPIALPFGNVLIIDTGSGAGYGGGAGINGELTQGKDSIYEFDNIEDFQNFTKGGYWWLLAQPMFRPNGLSSNGVSKIFWIKAATTTAAKIFFRFFGDGHDSTSQIGSPNGGDLHIKITDEGLIGNGVLTSTLLTKGYAAIMEAGTIDTSKFVLKFYVGSYKGLDQNGLPYDGIYDTQTTPTLLCQSIEFDNITPLITWMQTDATFLKYFKLDDYSVSNTGAVDIHDLEDYADYNLAYGGTETYAASTLLDAALVAAADAQVNFVLADQYGVNATSAANDKLANFVVNTSKWSPELYVGGGDDINTFSSISIAATDHFDQDSVSIVHGAIKKQSQLGLRTYDALYKTAQILAREAGLEPQVPITFKNIDIDGEAHKLNTKEITQALDAGLIVTVLDGGSFEIVKGVNSLQNNTYLVNNDGTTSSKQIKRIARQINNGIRVNAKLELLKTPFGVNRNTLSENDVYNWTVKYLSSLKALPDTDNLIISFQDIVVTRQADAYKITYKFTPNSEISFLFFTGLIIGI